MKKRLFRSKKNKMIAGVCGGIADYFKIDSTIVRVLLVLIAFSSIEGFVIGYIIAAIVIPERADDYIDDEDDVEILDQEGKAVGGHRNTKQILGIILVGAGGLMLLSRTVSWLDNRMLFAVAIIGVGIYVLFKKDKEV